MQPAITHEGSAPEWAESALSEVRGLIRAESDYEHLHELGIHVAQWAEDFAFADIHTGLSEDGDDLALVQSLFQSVCSIGETYQASTGVYTIRLLN